MLLTNSNLLDGLVWFMVFDATFNNISVISNLLEFVVKHKHL